MVSLISRHLPFVVESVIRGGCVAIAGTFRHFVKVTTPLCFRLSQSNVDRHFTDPECSKLDLSSQSPDLCFMSFQSVVRSATGHHINPSSISFCTQKTEEKLFTGLSEMCACVIKKSMELLSLNDIKSEKHALSVFHGSEQILEESSHSRFLVALVIIAVAENIFSRLRGLSARQLILGGVGAACILAPCLGIPILELGLGYASYRALFQFIIQNIHQFNSAYEEIPATSENV